MILLPLAIALIVLIFSALSLREKTVFDRKILYILLAKYSSCLMFAIVEFLYLRMKGDLKMFWILLVYDSLLAILMGSGILRIAKSPKEDEAFYRAVSGTSGYLFPEILGLLAMVFLHI